MLQDFVLVLLDRKRAQSFQQRMFCHHFLPPLLPAGAAVELPLQPRILIQGLGFRVQNVE